VSTRPVIFLSDFGDADEFAGVCRAVIERHAPGAQVIDLAHGIAAGDVRRGALALAAAVPYAPRDAVYLAVVDPGVGTERRALALRAANSFLVGPDNGLLELAADALGGVQEAVDISATPVRLEPTSHTFHGRDIFSPVAAALARGGEPSGLGDSVALDTLHSLELPEPEVKDGQVLANVLYADAFGNVVLDATAADLATAGLAEATQLAIRAGQLTRTATRGRTFADAGAGLVLYDDSAGRLGLALSGASASRELGVARDREIEIRAE
jgi:S-adenosylmethionine hydrolase